MSLAATRWRSLRHSATLGRALRPHRAKIALVLLGLVLIVCIFGPLMSPYGPADVVGAPFQTPSYGHLLGTDFLGRDVLSRFLNGGRTVVVIAVVSTLAAYIVAVPLGIIAALRRGFTDLGFVAISDVIYALPPLIFLLVLLAAAGPSLLAIVIGIALIHAPRVLRITRLVTIDISTREFVEAAFARGERLLAVTFRDILPNILMPLFADFGVRLSVSIILYASISYLGLGPPPPAADWGSMISENRIGLTITPWIVVAPVIAIAVFAVAVNMLADSFARAVGQSEVAGRD